MRLGAFLSALRPALPLLLGLSLGCSLSLLRASWSHSAAEERCLAPGPPAPPARGAPPETGEGRPGPGHEDFRPRIVPYYRDPNKPYKKVLSCLSCRYVLPLQNSLHPDRIGIP